MVADGIIAESQRAAAETEYREWMRDLAASPSPCTSLPLKVRTDCRRSGTAPQHSHVDSSFPAGSAGSPSLFNRWSLGISPNTVSTTTLPLIAKAMGMLRIVARPPIASHPKELIPMVEK